MTYFPSLRFLLFLLLSVTLCDVYSESLWRQREYHPSPFVIRDSAVTASHHAGTHSDMLTVEVRGAMTGIGERAGMAPVYWGYNVIGTGGDTLSVSLRHGNTDFGDLLDRRFTRVVIACGARTVFSQDYMDGFATSSGNYNTFLLELDCKNGSLRLAGGSRSAAPIADIPYDTGDLSDLSVEVWAKGELEVSSLSTEAHHSVAAGLASGWSVKSLDERFASTTDPLEGYWRYLDRQNDRDYARLGGRYVLAVVKSDVIDGGYDVIYVAGAETMARSWVSGMIKGHLLPTIFQSHYDLRWYDSTFEPMSRDIHASVTDNAIMTFSFPLLRTTLRFSKAPRHQE
ncbi:MAG: hypothetical protein K2J65_02940 [Duncaniella sp.]|nr:hypothetical protein [Duncaniella sp.]